MAYSRWQPAGAKDTMFTSGTGKTLFDYLSAQRSGAADTSASSSTGLTSAAQARVSATAAAALQTAASSGRASMAGQALDAKQAALAGDLRGALAKAGVTLSGAIEFSVASDNAVSTKSSAADKAAVTAFLATDTSKPSFATRIATQARDALSLSASVQKRAAVSQAARYGGGSGGVMTLYTSLMQQSSTGAAVFTVGVGSSSLSYPGSLAAKA